MKEARDEGWGERWLKKTHKKNTDGLIKTQTALVLPAITMHQSNSV